MSFTDIKTKSQGFTIVELLIVVVVIAILAAITIVSYNGITRRADASAAEAAAKTVATKAELFAADSTTGTYPAALTDLTTASGADTWGGLSASNFTAANADPTSASKTLVRYEICRADNGLAHPVVGGRVAYWNYAATSPAVAYKNLGTTSGGSVTCAITFS